MSQLMLEARALHVGYQGQAVARNLNIAVRAGEIVSLFGPNGSGKTTTLLTLAGELTPIAGETRLFGEPNRLRLYQRVRQGLAFITDERSLIFGLTARENLRLRGGSVDAALRFFPELEPHLDRSAGLLSGGQQQMVAMGRSLASNPRALMADELSLGLAPQLVNRLLGALRQAADDGLAVLLVEQHVAKALAISDRGYVLGHGGIVMEGRGDELSGRLQEIEAAYLAAAS